MSELAKAVQQWTKVLGGLETAHSAALGIPGVTAEDVAHRIEQVQKAVGALAAYEMERLTGGDS